jgi:hypothetical protein
MGMLYGYLMPLIGMIPSIIILIGCIILWTRMRGLDAMLMLIARSICIIAAVMRLVFLAVVTPGAVSKGVFLGINNGLVIASMAGSLIFAFAFLHVARSIGAAR